MGTGLGIIPGILVFSVVLILEGEGEAALSFGIMGVFLMIVGVGLGAALGGIRTENPGGKTLRGALIGAIPGVLLGFTPLGLPVIVIGVFVGYRIGKSQEDPSGRTPIPH
jgi:hypothetical protein